MDGLSLRVVRSISAEGLVPQQQTPQTSPTRVREQAPVS